MVEGDDGGDRTQGAQESLGFFIQDAESSRTTLVDACNGFNELIRLAMLWTEQHLWPEGERFVFNCYSYWAQLLRRQSGEPPVKIRSIEEVTQGDPL